MANAADHLVGEHRHDEDRRATRSTARSRRASTTRRSRRAWKAPEPPARSGQLKQTGSLINSVISATYRPFKNVYGTSADTSRAGQDHRQSERQAGQAPAGPPRWATPAPASSPGPRTATCPRPRAPHGSRASSSDTSPPRFENKEATSELGRGWLRVRFRLHHRQSAVPQFSPAPKPEVRRRSPRSIWPSCDQLVEGDRDRAGGGVAVPLQVLEDGVAVEARGRRWRRG